MQAYSFNNNNKKRKTKTSGGWVRVLISSYMLPFFKNVTLSSIVKDIEKRQLPQLLPCTSDHNCDSLPLLQWQTAWQCSYDLVSSTLQTLASEHPQDEGNLDC